MAFSPSSVTAAEKKAWRAWRAASSETGLVGSASRCHEAVWKAHP